DNVVAANRVFDCIGAGIILHGGAARNLVVGNVVNDCFVGIWVANDFGPGVAAGPNNQILHNVPGGGWGGVEVSVSRTMLQGNVATFNAFVGIDLQEFCDPRKITQTALKGNVAAQNNAPDSPYYSVDQFDIRVDARAQRPVLRGNTYQTSGVS